MVGGRRCKEAAAEAHTREQVVSRLLQQGGNWSPPGGRVGKQGRGVEAQRAQKKKHEGAAGRYNRGVGFLLLIL